MKQNPFIPAVLEYACMALTNISVNPDNQVIAGKAGAVQVHISASSYPPLKEEKNFPRNTLGVRVRVALTLILTILKVGLG